MKIVRKHNYIKMQHSSYIYSFTFDSSYRNIRQSYLSSVTPRLFWALLTTKRASELRHCARDMYIINLPALIDSATVKRLFLFRFLTRAESRRDRVKLNPHFTICRNNFTHLAIIRGRVKFTIVAAFSFQSYTQSKMFSLWNTVGDKMWDTNREREITALRLFTFYMTCSRLRAFTTFLRSSRLLDSVLFRDCLSSRRVYLLRIRFSIKSSRKISYEVNFVLYYCTTK